MTAMDKAALRALAEKATPGPWNKFEGDDLGFPCVAQRMEDGWVMGHVCTFDADSEPGNEANAAYIAAAHPQAVLALLDENARLGEALKWMAQKGGLGLDVHALIDAALAETGA